MPSWTLFALILAALWPQPAAAQSAHPRENTVAVGGGVGFLASDNGTPDVAQTPQATTGDVDAFFEYYYTLRVSPRVMYGWASPEIDSTFASLTSVSSTTASWAAPGHSPPSAAGPTFHPGATSVESRTLE